MMWDGTTNETKGTGLQIAQRSPEEIRAKLERRFEELQNLANSPQMKWPCSNCRWGRRDIHGDVTICSNALVKGFGETASNVDYDLRYRQHFAALASNVDYGVQYSQYASPAIEFCGREKALWEEKIPLWKRILGLESYD